MTPFITALIITSGICLAAGGMHLSITLRRREAAAGLLFAAMCFSAAVNAMLDAAVFQAADPAAFVPLFKWQAGVQGIFWTSLTWFVVFQKGCARRWLAWAVTGAFALALVVNMASPAGVFFLAIEPLPLVDLPWGERIAYASGEANPLRVVADIGGCLMAGLIAECALRLYRKGLRREAAILGGGVLPCLAIAYLHGTLVQAGIVGPPPMSSFALLVLILILYASLTGELLRASEAALEIAANERRWRALIENINLMVSAIDRDKKISYVNPRFLEVTGFSRREMVGRRFLEFVAEKDRGPALERFQRAMNGRVRSRYTSTLMKKDGAEARISWFSLALQDDSGSTAGLISVGEDVTAAEVAREAQRLVRDQALAELREVTGRLEADNAALRARMAQELSSEEAGQQRPVSAPNEPPADDEPLMPMEEIERRHILEALKRASGRIKGPGGAAELLGMNPSTLRNRMKRCGVARP